MSTNLYKFTTGGDEILLVEKAAAFKKKALETKALADVMKFFYSIYELTQFYGGNKVIFKSSWHKQKPDVWASLQSDIFAWILMMVLQKQDTEKSWSLIFYEYMCDEKYSLFNSVRPQVTETFAELLKGFKPFLPQDLHLEIESVIEYFSYHHLDPYSATIGLTAPREVVNKSQHVSSELMEMMLENDYFSQDDKRRKKVDFKERYMELLKKIISISLIHVPEDVNNELQRFVAMLRGVHQLPCGSIVLVNVDENVKDGTWKYARVARRSQGTLVLVYLDPRESIVSSFPFSRVLPISEDILCEFRTQDNPALLEPYIEHPQTVVMRSLLQHYTKEAQLFLESSKIDLEVFQLAMKEQMTIFHSEELKKITQMLKNPPRSLLNRMKDEASKIISHYCNTLNTSPPWTIFQPSKDNRKNELQSFQGDELFSLELKNYLKVCENALTVINKKKEKVLSGEQKEELNSWWHELIQTSVENYLENQGYDNSAVGSNYVDQPPKNILVVKQNLSLLQRILHSFYQNIDAFKLKDLIKSLCSKIYVRIDKYIKEVKFCLCERLKVKEYNAENIIKRIKSAVDLDEDTKLSYENLVHDNSYLTEMEDMERMRPEDRGRLDIVPVSGLILSVLCREENECRTVMDLWENKAYLNKEDEFKSPLEDAVLRCDIKALDALLRSGHFVNEQDSEGWTILHLSCSYWGNQARLDVTKYLIENEEINILTTNNYGSTALHFLVRMPIADNEKPAFISLLKFYLRNPLVVHVSDKKGETPLHVASLAGNLIAARELLVADADPNCVTNGGETSLHYAVSTQRKEIVKLLLDSCADPNIKNEQGETPLDLAKKLNLPEIRQLLEKGIELWNAKKIEQSQRLADRRLQSVGTLRNAKNLSPLWRKENSGSSLVSSVSSSSIHSQEKEDDKISWKRRTNYENLPPELLAALSETSGSSDMYRSSSGMSAPIFSEPVKEELEEKVKSPSMMNRTVSSPNFKKTKVGTNMQPQIEALDANGKPIIPPRPTTLRGQHLRIALYSFEGKKEEGELSFTVNSVIKVINEDKSGWWVGELNGNTGIFPANYTEKYTKPNNNNNNNTTTTNNNINSNNTPINTSPLTTQSTSTPPAAINNSNNANNNKPPKPIINTTTNNNNAAVAANNKPPITPKPVMNTAADNKRPPISPKPNLTPTSAPTPTTTTPSPPQSQSQPPISPTHTNSPSSTTATVNNNNNNTTSAGGRGSIRELPKVPTASDTRPTALVLGDYFENTGECLGLRKGEKVKVIEQSEDGWWTCQNVKGETGLFPRTFLEIVPSAVKPQTPRPLPPHP